MVDCLKIKPDRNKVLLPTLIIIVITGLLAGTVLAATTVTPSDTAPTAVNPLLWGEANVRNDASVGITTTQPRSGNGSLEFSTNTITPGQDKADFEIFWEDATTTPIDHPTRTLNNLSRLEYEFYRDGSSTTAAHFAPVLRLYVFNQDTGHIALLIWEDVYNGGSVADDTWVSKDILNGNFWMYVPGGQGIPSGVVQNFGVTLNDWITGSPAGQPSDPTPIPIDTNTLVIGINVGVGSWWGDSFLGFVDNVVIEFNGNDEVSANFEPDPLPIYLPIIFK